MTVLTRKSTPEEDLQILRSQLINEANKLLTLAAKVLNTTTSPEKPEAAPEVNEAKFHEFRISALSWLSRIFGADHITTSSFKNEVTHATASRTTRGVGIIEAAKQQLQGDWLTTTGAKSPSVSSPPLCAGQRHSLQKATAVPRLSFAVA